MSSDAINIEMYEDCDEVRVYDVQFEPYNRLNNEPYRSPYTRDYARLVHSPSFRRLQGKSQLFPGNESDFFRNRLTHSIEVAQIASAIARRINWILSGEPTRRQDIKNYVDIDLVQFAGLAHDLGHPPFGHQGELELNNIMQYHGGFEGNAQTLRLLSKIEKKVKYESSGKEKKDNIYGIAEDGTDERYGLNLTCRSLAAILKYDSIIEIKERPKVDANVNVQIDSYLNTKQEAEDCKVDKGYYKSELDIVKEIKKNIRGAKKMVKMKTIEMQIMDIADDIAYCVFDLEDSLKGNFINPLDLVADTEDIFEKVSQSANTKLERTDINKDTVKRIVGTVFTELVKKVDMKEISMEQANEIIGGGEMQSLITSYAYTTSKNQSKNGYHRNQFTSLLIGKFVRSVNIELDYEFPAFSKVYIDKDCKISDHNMKDADLTIEILKRFTYESQIQSHKLKIVESRGRDIVKTVFEKLLRSKGEFLPEDYRHNYSKISTIANSYNREIAQYRLICDFVSSMTDKYAVEFYGRLKSENPQSIFKSI